MGGAQHFTPPTAQVPSGGGDQAAQCQMSMQHLWTEWRKTHILIVYVEQRYNSKFTC